MKYRSIRLLAAVALSCAASWAQATLTCTNPVSSGFSTAINTLTSAVPNVTQGLISFTCTRTAAGDPTSLLLRANNGVNATGQSNRARRVAFTNYILYEGYQDSACATMWTRNNNATAIPFTLLSITGTAQPVNLSFWGCITTLAGQAITAGTYTDTVTMRVRSVTPAAWYTANNVATFPVSITIQATCSIPSPGNIAFTYAAFGPAVDASSTFNINCSDSLPYTMSLDAYSGVIAGLHYDLNINTAPPRAGSLPVNSRGTGAVQTHTIYGNMLAGQAGTCTTGTCPGSQSRTLTITY